MSAICERVDAFFDGELSPEEAAEFREHLAGCDACARELGELAALAALTTKHAAALRPRVEAPRQAPVAPTVSIASHPRWRRALPAAAAIAVAAAAAVAIFVRRPTPPAPPEAPVALLEGTSRGIEARVAYPAADRYRPYDVNRGADSTRGDQVSLRALAELEARKDVEGVAAGLLLSGERDRAASMLAQAPSTPAVEIDRAVLALGRGQLEEALNRLDTIPSSSPFAAQASWDRALVLRELRLPLAAAESFERVASLGEVGWADEARAKAKALRDDVASHDKSWAAAKDAGRALVMSGAAPAPELLRAYPSYFRGQIYHALRAAPTAERARGLASVASTLDAGNAQAPLSRYAAMVASKSFAKRGALAADYSRLYDDRGAFDDAAIEHLLAAARGAGADDIAFGVLELARRPNSAAEMARIARAGNDPWLDVTAQGAKAREETQSGNFTAAESTLRQAIDLAASNAFDSLRVRLDYQLTELLLRVQRATDAASVATAAIPRAEAHARDLLRHLELTMGDVARLRSASALQRAYLREALLRAPDECENRRFIAEQLAVDRLEALDARGAREALEAGPRCGKPITPLRTYIVSSVARMGERTPEASSLEHDVEEARGALTAGERATIDVLRGHFVLQSDVARGKELVENGLAGASKLPADDSNAQVARAFAYLTLALEAAKNGNGADAVALLAADAHVTGEVRCALAVAVDYERALSAAVDANGVGVVHYDAAVKRPAIDPATLVPPEVRARLSGCPEVQVFAPAPVHGTASLLPAEFAWSYRIGVSGAAASSPQAPAPAPRRLFVSDVEPPASLGLPRLQRTGAPPDADPSTIWLHGASATPARVLAELTTATEAQIHAHGFVDRGTDEASVLALSPDANGKYALTASDIRATHLRGRPIVVLGACEAAHVAPYYHEPWSLPLAFIRSGARAVFAAPAPIRDSEAGPFFQAVLARVREGATPAQALRDVRVASLKSADSEWIRSVLAFD